METENNLKAKKLMTEGIEVECYCERCNKVLICSEKDIDEGSFPFSPDMNINRVHLSRYISLCEECYEKAEEEILKSPDQVIEDEATGERIYVYEGEDFTEEEWKKYNGGTVEEHDSFWKPFINYTVHEN